MSSTTELESDVMVEPVTTGEIIDEKKLAQQLLEQSREQSREQGVGLIGPGGLLSGLTKTVLEAALEAEMTEHLGHEHGETPMGSNMRNGLRTKTVLTEIGPVEIEVPRDRDGSFEPMIVPKRKRRLDGIDEIVLSLTARGLTTGEVAAHFTDVYGATVSKDTISRITEKVAGEMAEWASRPLDPGLSGDLRRCAGDQGERGSGPQHPVLRGHGRDDQRGAGHPGYLGRRRRR